MEQEKEYRERAKAYFNSKTPCHIITKQDDWVNGFVVAEPNEFYFEVLDRKDGVVKVHYIDIDIFQEFIGQIESLPVPKKKEVEDEVGN